LVDFEILDMDIGVSQSIDASPHHIPYFHSKTLGIGHHVLVNERFAEEFWNKSRSNGRRTRGLHIPFPDVRPPPRNKRINPGSLIVKPDLAEHGLPEVSSLITKQMHKGKPVG